MNITNRAAQMAAGVRVDDLTFAEMAIEQTLSDMFKLHTVKSSKLR